MFIAIGRNTDGNFVFVLIQGPVHHGEVFFNIRRGKVNDFRDRSDHRNVPEAKVSQVCQGTNTSSHNRHDGRTVVHGPVLFKLVISSLKEGCHYRVDNLGTASGCAGHCGNTGLFGNCNVNVLVAAGFSFLFHEAEDFRCCGRNDEQFRIFFNLSE